jgi:Methyltransferase domain
VDRGVTVGLSVPQYSAIDGSPDALERAERARPGGHFLPGTLADHPVTADVTISLGALDGAPGGGREEQVGRLWHSAGRALVVSEGAGPEGGADQFPAPTGEPLWLLLRRIAPEAEVYAVGDQREDIFLVLRPPPTRHPRDFLPTTLDPLMARHPDPLTLATIRIHAWRTLRFYPDHAPRLWEYPVAAQLIADHLPGGSRLIDIGAGTTPLAPFLTHRGYVVDTVDPSPRRREWPPEDDWNEWDFLDYGRAGLAHRSWNTTVDKVPSRARFDGAYSISVIEHVPAADRRAMLAAIAGRVRSGGLVVLTIDLARGSDRLWNRNLGVEVEDPSSHGTFDDVVDEGARVGLQLLRRETVRDWGDTNVDIGLLAFRRAEDSGPEGGGATRFGRRALRRLGWPPGPTS